MSLEFLFWLLAGAAAGGFVNGLAGFGTALFALAFWLNILPPQQAVAIILIMSTLGSVQGVYFIRSTIAANSGRLLQFLLPALAGVPLGLMMLEYIEADTLKLVIGFFMLFYGGFFILRRSLPLLVGDRGYTQAVIGFVSGILGGAASLSGALPTMWCALRPWPKAEQRAVLQPFSVVVLAVSAMILFAKGIYDSQTLILIAITLPITLLTAHWGLAVYHRLQDTQFKRLLIILMFVSGFAILAGELV